MKKYSLLILLTASVLIYGCTKALNNDGPTPEPTFSIKSVSLPSFANSTWTNVTGGEMKVEFEQVNAAGAVTSTITDSTAYINVDLYSRILASGTYNVSISSTSKSVADTFLRFNAQLKGLSITDKVAESLTASTPDGLITIGKNLVQNGTVPTFKADSGATYKFGLVNGFYFLYVKGSTNGTLTFSAQANGQTETLSKHMSIATLTQYNVALQSNSGSIQLTFAPFAYNQVPVSSSTLLTLNINPNAFDAASGTVYYIATDADGNVLNAVKYLPGTTTFKISSLQPYEQTRFNFFQLIVPTSANEVPTIVGHLQVKKGSTYTSNLPSLATKPSTSLGVIYQDLTAFDLLSVSTDGGGASSTSISNLAAESSLNYSAGSKLWVQELKNNQYAYQFFNIPSGATSLNVDMNDLTKTPNAQTITGPGSDLDVQVFARADTNYTNAYNFGPTYAQANHLTYYYPTESFEQYDVMMTYTLGNLKYTTVTAGSTIPNQAASFNASFQLSASSIGNFAPVISGTYDYYEAVFSDPSNKLQISLFSPSSAKYTNIHLPDFSKYLGAQTPDINTMPLKFFGLYQVSGFNETNFYYRNYHSYIYINSKAVEESF